MSIIGSEGVVIVLTWVTKEQLAHIKTVLDEMCEEAANQVNDVHEGSPIPEELMLHWCSLQNLCCDLDIPGYEMS